MTDFRWYGGIDFSGAKEPLANLWSALGVERDGRLHIVALQPHPFREDLAWYVAGGWRRSLDAPEGERILWAADFPFGVPRLVADRLAGVDSGWDAVAAWIADRPADEVREAAGLDMHKRGRTCDSGGAMAPFDLRLYRQTVEGIRWLHGLREEAGVSILPQAPVDGAATVLIEAYPAGTVKELGIKGGKVPSRPGEVRARPAGLRSFVTFDHPSMEATACTLEDARDAVIAALVAWLCRDDLDQPARLGRVPAPLLAVEGWIYRAPSTLG